MGNGVLTLKCDVKLNNHADTDIEFSTSTGNRSEFQQVLSKDYSVELKSSIEKADSLERKANIFRRDELKEAQTNLTTKVSELIQEGKLADVSNALNTICADPKGRKGVIESIRIGIANGLLAQGKSGEEVRNLMGTITKDALLQYLRASEGSGSFANSKENGDYSFQVIKERIKALGIKETDQQQAIAERIAELGDKAAPTASDVAQVNQLVDKFKVDVPQSRKQMLEKYELIATNFISQEMQQYSVKELTSAMRQLRDDDTNRFTQALAANGMAHLSEQQLLSLTSKEMERKVEDAITNNATTEKLNEMYSDIAKFEARNKVKVDNLTILERELEKRRTILLDNLTIEIEDILAIKGSVKEKCLRIEEALKGTITKEERVELLSTILRNMVDKRLEKVTNQAELAALYNEFMEFGRTLRLNDKHPDIKIVMQSLANRQNEYKSDLSDRRTVALTQYLSASDSIDTEKINQLISGLNKSQANVAIAKAFEQRVNNILQNDSFEALQKIRDERDLLLNTYDGLGSISAMKHAGTQIALRDQDIYQKKGIDARLRIITLLTDENSPDFEQSLKEARKSVVDARLFYGEIRVIANEAVIKLTKDIITNMRSEDTALQDKAVKQMTQLGKVIKQFNLQKEASQQLRMDTVTNSELNLIIKHSGISLGE